jgi:hypothetical protein
MKGAIALPVERTIKTPKRSSVKITGTSQYFFLTFKKPQRSLKKSISLSLKR